MERSRDYKGAFTERRAGGADTDSRYLAIRASLLTLPKVQAPAGFEFRLQRRINRLGYRHTEKVWESWIFTRRWLSVGLGAATAVIVGLLFFQPQQPELPSSAFTQEIQPATPSVPNPFPVAMSTDEFEGERSFTGSPEREIEGDLLAEDKQKEETRDRSFNPPSGHFQAVGGNGRPVYNP